MEASVYVGLNKRDVLLQLHCGVPIDLLMQLPVLEVPIPESLSISFPVPQMPFSLYQQTILCYKSKVKQFVLELT